MTDSLCVSAAPGWRAGATARLSPVTLEACAGAAVTAAVAATLAWLGPPGIDLAAHEYQRMLFLHHGFQLWNNSWYAGRYGFVTYSLLYYPLAALVGIKLLAVVTLSAATLAYTFVAYARWGSAARWSSRTFAIVWPGIVFSAAFPFALGAALALFALWAVQSGRQRRFALLVVLTMLASPLAFLLLALLLAASAAGAIRQLASRRFALAVVAVVAAAELVLWRAFPSDGQFPFRPNELAAVALFCVAGATLTWRIERARPLSAVFVVYLAACALTYVFPWEIGSNIVRLRYLALPMMVLVLSLRRWHPRLLCIAALAWTGFWNIGLIVENFARAAADSSTSVRFWAPAIRFLRANSASAYRVEVVDTTGHWAAMRLPAAGIALARGWFRQDDFPQNRLLYGRLTATAYAAWLRSLGIRYVVLPRSRHDYSARAEANLLRSGKSGLRPVFRTPSVTIYAVQAPRALITGPADARVLSLTSEHVVLALPRPGKYRLAVHFSPYWHSQTACIAAAPDGMMDVVARQGGRTELYFDVGFIRALATVFGETSSCR